jgi:putative nucleotidyltransferase with HDIG domain
MRHGLGQLHALCLQWKHRSATQPQGIFFTPGYASRAGISGCPGEAQATPRHKLPPGRSISRPGGSRDIALVKSVEIFYFRENPDPRDNGLSNDMTLFDPFPAESRGLVPSDQDCERFWDLCRTPEHIREHSSLVADLTDELMLAALDCGLTGDRQLARAAGLLHDLGKAYTIRHGGSHCQLGASWVMDLTGNPAIAQCVLHHISWPGALDPEIHLIPLIIVYSDKRVQHTRIVSLQERYRDILERYGIDAGMVEAIKASFARVQAIEQTLSERLEVDLHAHPFTGRRLVR